MDRTVQPIRNYIDGNFGKPTEEMGVWLEDPNTKERIQQQMGSSDADIESALDSAARAYSDGDWPKLDAEERCGLDGRSGGVAVSIAVWCIPPSSCTRVAQHWGLGASSSDAKSLIP